MKKILALLLALALLLPTVAMAELNRVSEDPVEFTFWAAYNPTFQTDWENMKCWKYLEEATGVHIKWELYTLNEMKDKLGITLAGGDPSVLPDAFFRCNITDTQLKKYGPEGMFLDISKLVREYAPNLCQKMDDMNAWGSMLDPETGALYATPTLKDSISSRILPNFYFNKHMMENVGWTTGAPKTTDELYDLLVLIRDNDANGNGDPGDEVGITSNSLTRIMNLFSGAFGINNRGREDLCVDADPADETKVRYVYTTEEYRKMLSYLNKLYTNNLIDSNIFSLKTSSMVALGSQNQIFGLAYHSLAAAGIDEADYIGMDEPIQGPDGYKAWNTTDSGIYKGAFVISAHCKQPEMLVKWIDNLYTYEGSLLINFGKEGEDWHYNEQHLPTWNDYILDQVNENTNYDLVTAQVSCYASGNVPCWFTDETFPGAQCRGLGYETSQKLAPYTNQQAWLFNFTIEEAEEVSALKADINTNCHDVWRADFIKGAKDVNDDAVWNEYVQQIESLGLEDMMYLYQTALDRMLETK